VSEPAADRPRFHESYGLWAATEGAGLLPWEWAAKRLAEAKNYWVATAGTDGRPQATPVWGVWRDGSFYFSTARGSRKGRNLEANPQAVVHLESGDEVVILEGAVEEVADPAALAELAEAYGAKYVLEIVFDGGGSAVYVLRPRRAFAWRERDYPESATRFTFP
jgi:PPOX class probable F420-dependent enzyme